MKEAFCKRRPFIHVFKNTNQLGIKESFEVKNEIKLRYQKKERKKSPSLRNNQPLILARFWRRPILFGCKKNLLPLVRAALMVRNPAIPLHHIYDTLDLHQDVDIVPHNNTPFWPQNPIHF